MWLIDNLMEKWLRLPQWFVGTNMKNIRDGIGSALQSWLNLIDPPVEVAQRIETQIDGKPYTLLCAGNSESPYSIVHIHGLVWNMENFVPQMCDDRFASFGHISPNRFNDIIVKQNTGLPKEGQMDLIVEYLHTLIREYAANKKILLHGASIWGEIAYNYAAKYPEQIKWVILCGASGLHNESFLGWKENMFTNIKDINRIQQKVNQHFVDPRMAPDNLAQSLQEMLQDRKQFLALMNLGRTSVKSDQERNIQLLQTIEQANIPVQLMRWAQDTITPPDVAIPRFEQSAQIPKKNIHIFENAHHMPNMDASVDDYNHRLKAFVNRSLMRHN